MGDSLITIIAIFLAAILMFVFPLMAVSERTDDISQLAVETSTTEFVDNIRNTGKLTLDNYSKYIEEITATGNSYDVEMEIQILDENPGVKTTQAETTKIGENVYYTLYDSQIKDRLGIGSNTNAKKQITLKEGDIVSVTVKNTNTTIAQTLRNFFYRIAGNDTYQVAAQHAGMVTVKMQPCGWLSVRRMLPPCASAMDLQRARPSPMLLLLSATVFFPQ